MKLRVTIATLVIAALSSSPAWSERMRLDCPYQGSGATLFDRPIGDGSVSFLIDEESRTTFIWSNGDWSALPVEELSSARMLFGQGFRYDISRTLGTIRITFDDMVAGVVPVGTGTCQRVAEAARRF